MDRQGKRTGMYPLDWRDDACIAEVACLQDRYMPQGPARAMGSYFLRKFYYKRLVKDKLLEGNVYLDKGECVGFISFTRFPYDFISEGYRRHFWYLLWVLAVSVCMKPGIIITLLRLSRRDATRKAGRPGDDDGATGEFLSFIVDETHRGHVDDASGIKVPNLLLESAIRHFSEIGYRRIRGEGRKTNKAAYLFYASYGFKMSGRPELEDGISEIVLELKHESATA